MDKETEVRSYDRAISYLREENDTHALIEKIVRNAVGHLYQNGSLYVAQHEGKQWAVWCEYGEMQVVALNRLRAILKDYFDELESRAERERQNTLDSIHEALALLPWLADDITGEAPEVTYSWSCHVSVVVQGGD